MYEYNQLLHEVGK